MPERWAIIVHGGAKTIPADREDASRAGCLAAVEAGKAVLEAGGTAIDAVSSAIKVLEDDPTFNAGYGAVVNAAGGIELDAALMDGEYLDVGAVAAVRGVRNPIELCRTLMMDIPVLLVGEGAAQYAKEKGVRLCEPDFHKASSSPSEAGCDTVGCVAMDASGHIAAGTSTGGLGGVRPGRVGDSPIPGCGLYAEDAVGGVSFSGDGESILRLALAARLMAILPTHGAKRTAEEAVGQMPRVGGEAGCIVIDATGRPDFAHNSEHFAVALATSSRDAETFLRRDEGTRG